MTREWSDPYKGQFDDGWDVFRQRIFDQQKRLGIIPAYATLPARNPNIKAWNALTADQKKVYARFMEVYAGYLTYADHQVGRLIDYLRQSGQLEHTLIFVVIGDNGASKEGTLAGTPSTGGSPAGTCRKKRPKSAETSTASERSRHPPTDTRPIIPLPEGGLQSGQHAIQILEAGCQRGGRVPATR